MPRAGPLLGALRIQISTRPLAYWVRNAGTKQEGSLAAHHAGAALHNVAVKSPSFEFGILVSSNGFQ